MVYLASSSALCVLEVRVHLDLPFSLIPDDYVLMTIDLDDLPVEQMAGSPPDPMVVGDQWLTEARTPLLEVPSAIVEESANLLLNPVHPSAASATVATVRPFSFDQRLWAE